MGWLGSAPIRPSPAFPIVQLRKLFNSPVAFSLDRVTAYQLYFFSIPWTFFLIPFTVKRHFLSFQQLIHLSDMEIIGVFCGSKVGNKGAI